MVAECGFLAVPEEMWSPAVRRAEVTGPRPLSGVFRPLPHNGRGRLTSQAEASVSTASSNSPASAAAGWVALGLVPLQGQAIT